MGGKQPSHEYRKGFYPFILIEESLMEFPKHQQAKLVFVDENKLDKSMFFISHRWIDSKISDLHNEQFKYIKRNFIEKLCFYDYTCLPQNPRNKKENDYFRTMLNNLNIIIRKCSMIIINTNDYLERSWCIFENQLGALYNNIDTPKEMNFTENTPAELLKLVVEHGDGDPQIVGSLSYFRKIFKTEATNSNDKRIIYEILIREFLIYLKIHEEIPNIRSEITRIKKLLNDHLYEPTDDVDNWPSIDENGIKLMNIEYRSFMKYLF